MVTDSISARSDFDSEPVLVTWILAEFSNGPHLQLQMCVRREVGGEWGGVVGCCGVEGLEDD